MWPLSRFQWQWNRGPEQAQVSDLHTCGACILLQLRLVFGGGMVMVTCTQAWHVCKTLPTRLGVCTGRGRCIERNCYCAHTCGLCDVGRLCASAARHDSSASLLLTWTSCMLRLLVQQRPRTAPSTFADMHKLIKLALSTFNRRFTWPRLVNYHTAL